MNGPELKELGLLFVNPPHLSLFQTLKLLKVSVILQVPRFEWFYVDVEGVSGWLGPLAETMKQYFNHKEAKHVIYEKNRKYIVSTFLRLPWPGLTLGSIGFR